MSTQTEHLKLDLREAADIFNPLSTNANFESLDNIIYEIQTKGGVPTYTTTASANLLKLSQNPTPNVTVFKFVAAGDANTWSYQETVNNIVALDGSKKTVKGGEMYVAWVNAANAMVVIAWPDVVNAQTFNGKGPAEWATKAQLDAVNQTAANATTTAQAAATVANQALETATGKPSFQLVKEFALATLGNNEMLEVPTVTEPKALAITFRNPSGYGRTSTFIAIKSGISETLDVVGFGNYATTPRFLGRQFVITPGAPTTIITAKTGYENKPGVAPVNVNNAVLIPEKVFAML